MTRPHHLRAQAALAALDQALHLLADRVIEEDRAIAAEHRAAAEPLASPAYGRRHALGGHGDPTADAIDTLGAPRANRWTELQREVWGQLRDVAQHLPGLDNPLIRMQRTLPRMSDRMAEATALLADRLDGRLRRLLHVPGDRRRLPGVRCPACDTAGMLALRTAAPEPDRVVECGACWAAWPAIEAYRNPMLPV